MRKFVVKKSRGTLKESEGECEVQGVVFSTKIESIIVCLSTDTNNSVEKEKLVMQERSETYWSAV